MTIPFAIEVLIVLEIYYFEFLAIETEYPLRYLFIEVILTKAIWLQALVGSP